MSRRRLSKLAWIGPLLLLLGLVVRNELGRRYRSHDRKDVWDVRAIDAALEQFARENGRYPQSLQALVTPDAQGLQFLDRVEVPLDPWGRPYGYEPPQRPGERPRVFTLGRDGRPGGSAEDRDLDNGAILRGDF